MPHLMLLKAVHLYTLTINSLLKRHFLNGGIGVEDQINYIEMGYII